MKTPVLPRWLTRSISVVFAVFVWNYWGLVCPAAFREFAVMGVLHRLQLLIALFISGLGSLLVRAVAFIVVATTKQIRIEMEEDEARKTTS